MEHLSARDSMKGTSGRAPLLGNAKDEDFERYVKCPVNGPLSLPHHRRPVGEPGGGSFAGTFERKEKHIWLPFLDPEDIKILSLGVIWNSGKGTGLS